MIEYSVIEYPAFYHACSNPGCPGRNPGPVCSLWQGTKETGQYCPRCGWVESVHPSRESRRSILLEAARHLDKQAQAHGEVIHDYTDLLRVWADDDARWFLGE